MNCSFLIKSLYTLIFFIFSITTNKLANAVELKENKHFLSLGLGHISIYRDFNDYGESGLLPSFIYSYEREKKYFPVLELHHYKNNYRGMFFSTSSINFALGHNLINVDSFYLSPLIGLGIYLPKVKRPIDGQLLDTESKAVFGANLGIDSILKLNESYGVGFKYQLHAPFSIKQVIGEELHGHYSTLIIKLTIII
jgi:hypothetical protein